MALTPTTARPMATAVPMTNCEMLLRMIASIEDDEESVVGEAALVVTGITGLRKILAVVRLVLQAGASVICWGLAG